jgi:hypothetical protein
VANPTTRPLPPPPPQKQPRYPLEAGWAPQPVWTFWIKIFCPYWDSNPEPPDSVIVSARCQLLLTNSAFPVTSVGTEFYGTEYRLECCLVQCIKTCKASLTWAPCYIGNFSDKRTQQVVDFIGARGMPEWEGTTIDWITARGSEVRSEATDVSVTWQTTLLSVNVH